MYKIPLCCLLSTSLALSLSLALALAAPQVAYLGPVGTYSDQAVQLVTRERAWESVPAASITEVSQWVASGQTPYGLIPLENSSGGYVAETAALLKQDPGWRVVGHVDLPIDNTLLVNPGTQLQDITTIISHPQPFLQSSLFLKSQFPNAKRIEAKSTAAAAEQVAKDGGKTVAAIAAPAAAQVYKLSALAERIQDDKANTTRFMVVQHAALDLSRPVQQAVLLYTPRPGALSAGLEQLLTGLRESGWQLGGLLSTPQGKLGEERLVLFASGPALPLQTLQARLKDTVLIGGY